MPSIKRAVLYSEYLNHHCTLPYGLLPSEVFEAMRRTYDFLYDLNQFLVEKAYPRLESLFLGNTFSGIVSEVLIRHLADCSQTMVRNLMVGGHPDLLVKDDQYPNNTALHAERGIEVKASKQTGGWQGHNPEDCWLLVFRYTIEEYHLDISPFEREPLTFVQVLGARLLREDWAFSGRSESSRRTIIASVKQSGMNKLRSNPIYQDPQFVVGRTAEEKERYRALHQRFSSHS